CSSRWRKLPDQSPTYTVPPTTAGVAVTVSRALKNQSCFRSFAVCGLRCVGHGYANRRSLPWPHVGQPHRPMGLVGVRVADAPGPGTPKHTSAPATTRHVTARFAVR